MPPGGGYAGQPYQGPSPGGSYRGPQQHRPPVGGYMGASIAPTPPAGPPAGPPPGIDHTLWEWFKVSSLSSKICALIFHLTCACFYMHVHTIDTV